MTRRRTRIWQILGAALLALLSGCHSDDPGPVLRVANWGGAGDDSEFYKITRNIYAEFENKENCHVQIEGIPGSQEYVSKMLMNYVAGSSPDIVTLDASSAAVFIENDTLMDLTPFIEKDPSFRLDDFFANVVDIARRDKKMLAIPGDFTPMVMYFNKRLFDEAGVPYPDGRWTFEQFREVAKQLTKRDAKGGMIQYGFQFPTTTSGNWMPGWITWLWNNGADVLSPDGSKASGYLDSDKSAEAITFLRDLVRDGYSSSPSGSAAAGVDLFLEGKSAMTVVGHWYIIGLKAATKIKMEDVGVCSVPTQLDKPVTVMYEAGLAISKQARNPELAWKYIKYFTSHEVQLRYNKTGIAVDGRRDVATERALDPLEKAFLDIVPTARGPWGARVPGYDFVESVGQQAMGNILNGMDVKTELHKAAKRIDDYFAIR